MTEEQRLQWRVNKLVEQRDEALTMAESLKKELAEIQSELHHLRHFRSSIQRQLRNMPRRCR